MAPSNGCIEVFAPFLFLFLSFTSLLFSVECQKGKDPSQLPWSNVDIASSEKERDRTCLRLSREKKYCTSSVTCMHTSCLVFVVVSSVSSVCPLSRSRYSLSIVQQLSPFARLVQVHLRSHIMSSE